MLRVSNEMFEEVKINNRDESAKFSLDVKIFKILKIHNFNFNRVKKWRLPWLRFCYTLKTSTLNYNCLK